MLVEKEKDKSIPNRKSIHKFYRPIKPIYIVESSCLCQSRTTSKTSDVLFVYTVKVFPS